MMQTHGYLLVQHFIANNYQVQVSNQEKVPDYKQGPCLVLKYNVACGLNDMYSSILKSYSM
jgi:hypothetical protein